MPKDKNPIISNDELIYYNKLEIQKAVCRILEKKEIMSKDELLTEVQNIKLEMEENLRKSQQSN